MDNRRARAPMRAGRPWPEKALRPETGDRTRRYTVVDVTDRRGGNHAQKPSTAISGVSARRPPTPEVSARGFTKVQTARGKADVSDGEKQGNLEVEKTRHFGSWKKKAFWNSEKCEAARLANALENLKRHGTSKFGI